LSGQGEKTEWEHRGSDHERSGRGKWESAFLLVDGDIRKKANKKLIEAAKMVST